ncbi:hypothetical protein D3C75_836660 [compost metagenome]
MREHFESQITNQINTNQKDPLMFYIVGGKAEHCPLSVVESLSETLTFVELRQLGAISLPVFSRK